MTDFKIAMAHDFRPLKGNPGMCARCKQGLRAVQHHVPNAETRMTCEEAGCTANAKGWFTVLDVATEDHAALANWIKRFSRRRFWEWDSLHALEEALRLQSRGELTVTPDLREMLSRMAIGLRVFCFPPGQQCFKNHLDREVVFKRNEYIHTRPVDFNEDMNERADRLGVLRQRG